MQPFAPLYVVRSAAWLFERSTRSPRAVRRNGSGPPIVGSAITIGIAPHEGRPATVEYLVRAARITDIDRVVALCDDDLRASRSEGMPRPLDTGDLLRQLVYLPQATVLVVETTRREVVGAAVLALRPSVRAGGYIGTIDLLAVDPRLTGEEVADVLIEELLRSAVNKACATVEAQRPRTAQEEARWERHGFRETGSVISRPVARGT